MSIIQESYFDFFKDLSQNNERDWFISHKNQYETTVKEPFLRLIEAIVTSLAETEPDLSLIPSKQMLFRINRDVRFSKDKKPYKEHLAASIGRFGTKDKIYPGHYFQLSAEGCFIAGGAYFFEEKETLLRVRRYIMDNNEAFESVISHPDFIKYCGQVKGEKNKRVPPEFADIYEKQPLILNTQFYWSVDIPATWALKPNFVEILRGYFLAAQPFNDFIRKAIYS